MLEISIYAKGFIVALALAVFPMMAAFGFGAFLDTSTVSSLALTYGVIGVLALFIGVIAAISCFIDTQELSELKKQQNTIAMLAFLDGVYAKLKDHEGLSFDNVELKEEVFALIKQFYEYS